ncbi:16S rRNA (uracil(1498)-N(3))-methyltransferase [Propioniciclava sp. MC1683]|uniref:16S rRNA (uracil(1498)-N(3))-methyltransferase n=1 Tax=Propioniciclava sp. MC1683 TaxID=2760309 RepID=UPI0015FEEB75|nr:16S rRNA (uracil(1498)-N(3))-methyltransferase [Propioniciclava sp. MC1683]MBB1500518.1 16S rRNA (uracil(1498)-N(3))-methyltransferase [Propioniciclava sp. MC1683]NLE18796.1 16S rRNA (uracil(1498)-N(3))-methyltransferase [Propioniciclava sp.]
MTEALFLADLHSPQVGDTVTVDGDEGRHAAAVRRIRVGETIMVADGAGTGVRGEVTATDRASVTLEVAEVLTSPEAPIRYHAVQALAKGDRAELAVEMLTELGIDRIIPWQSSRSVVKWTHDREERQLGRWRTTAREATKQSRRLRVPIITSAMTTRELVELIPTMAVTFILHEGAELTLRHFDLPEEGDVLIIIGPEGGLTDEEVATLEAAGARQLLLSDGVLRTSTAGTVALAQLQAFQKRVSQPK